MNNGVARDFEIVRSGSWWKDFHERRRARRLATPASASTSNRDMPTFHALSQPDMAYTFVPGRAQPITRVVGAPRPPPTAPRTGGGVVRQRNTYVPPRGTNTYLASRARDDEVTLHRLTQSKNQRLVDKARRGYLKEAGNFVGQSDDEILAYLKTPRGRAELAAAEAANVRSSRDKLQRAQEGGGVVSEGMRLQLEFAQEIERVRGPRGQHDRALCAAQKRRSAASSSRSQL
ncbi:hypothetical protein C8R46DRAFT_1214534 [Mycena filopes]|nr:hypothetical protein C8R46DRAFT_1214534 [Mycena filopes]